MRTDFGEVRSECEYNTPNPNTLSNTEKPVTVSNTANTNTVFNTPNNSLASKTGAITHLLLCDDCATHGL